MAALEVSTTFGRVYYCYVGQYLVFFWDPMQFGQMTVSRAVSV